jgi:hypothetical protein
MVPVLALPLPPRPRPSPSFSSSFFSGPSEMRDRPQYSSPGSFCGWWLISLQGSVCRVSCVVLRACVVLCVSYFVGHIRDDPRAWRCVAVIRGHCNADKFFG